MNKYFNILGLEEGASQEAIQEAYNRLSRELDPAKNGNQEFFIEEYEILQQAYYALTNNSDALPITSQQKKTTASNNSDLKRPNLETNFGLKNDLVKLFSSKNIIYSLVAIIFVLLAIQKCKSNVDSDTSPVAIDTTAVAVDTAAVGVDNGWIPPPDAIEVFETPENGFSPYNDYFGQGVYENGTNNEFVIKNSNQSDAIICLVDYNTDLKIRNEFIRKGTTFKLSNVPNGTYYLAWFSGNDWSPYKIMMGNVEGGFQTDASFSKSDGPSDLMECYGDRRWTITLYSVVNGNMNQTEMSENDFFKPSP